MSQHTLLLDVVEVTRETPDAITIHLEHPEKLTIPYHPGQFLTLLVPINGKKERRAYSLCSSQAEQPRLAVTVKRIPDGLISSYLFKQLKPGDKMEVLAPMGNFCLYPSLEASRTVVLIAAGSGITPLLSMAKSVLEQETKSKVLLIYGNRNENTVIFKNRLVQLLKQYPNRFTVEHVYSQPLNGAGTSEIKKSTSLLSKLFGKKEEAPITAEIKNDTKYFAGRLNRTTLIKILEKNQLIDFLDTEYYMCGPEGLMTEAKEALKILKVPAQQIFKESFVSSGNNAADTGQSLNGPEDNQKIKDQVVTIQYEGSEYKITVPKEQTILEAALNQNVDLPFSCQAGLCTACRGKCLSGKVHLDERDGLSDAEVEEGYVLTCVGHPLSTDVVIEIG